MGPLRTHSTGEITLPKKKITGSLGVWVCLLLLSGCGISHQAVSHHISAVPSIHTAPQATPSMSGLFASSLVLPDGTTVTSTHSGVWHHIRFAIAIQAAVSGSGSGPRYATVIDNHSTVNQHSKFNTAEGPADFLAVTMTPPAASESNIPTYQYWVIVFKSHYTYAIVATVNALSPSAAEAVRNATKHWTIPTQ